MAHAIPTIFKKADLARLASKHRQNLDRDLGDTLPEPDYRGTPTKDGEEGEPYYSEETVLAWCEANGIPYDVRKVMKR